MTALTLGIDWYHCHRVTATFDVGGCHNLKKLPHITHTAIFVFVIISTTRPILPLSLLFLHQSNRADLLCRLIPLSTNHCHSLPFHCHPNTAMSTTVTFLSFFLYFFPIVTTRSILPLPHCVWYHSNRRDLTNRLVLLSTCHCHSPPPQPSPPATPPSHPPPPSASCSTWRATCTSRSTTTFRIRWAKMGPTHTGGIRCVFGPFMCGFWSFMSVFGWFLTILT
jgi:hypothetical protein